MWDMLLSAGTKLVGAYITSEANDDAADKAAGARREGGEVWAQNLEKAKGEQMQFAREGQDYLKDARSDEGLGLTYLQRVVADEGSLTPAQQRALENLRRGVSNQIGTSSMAGSGRTASALFKRVESDFTNDALEKNRARALTAAGGMADRSASFARGIGDISVGIGDKQAGLTSKIGEVKGGAIADAGAIEAQGIAANGALWGQTIGSIGGTIADQGRQSRYRALS